jgi:hypothetical protein
VTAYGDVPQRLIDMANLRGSVLERYSFLQGLQLEPTVRVTKADHPTASRPSSGQAPPVVRTSLNSNGRRPHP